MPTLSAKRQITLPKRLCNRLAWEAGDDLLILEHGGRITILKRSDGASKGVLGGAEIDRSFSDGESRDAAIADEDGV